VLAMALATFCGYVPWPTLPIYAVASLVAYRLYSQDKRAAQAGAWRTPEEKLLVVGLLCGWPGALVAQQAMRHKTNKPSFQAMYWITVVINLAVLAYIGHGMGA
jgi:uncharacterized membrane protein YsdA (DUF1294 family)